MRKLTKLIKAEISLFKKCWAKPKPRTLDADMYIIETRENQRAKNYKTKGKYR